MCVHTCFFLLQRLDKEVYFKITHFISVIFSLHLNARMKMTTLMTFKHFEINEIPALRRNMSPMSVSEMEILCSER